MSESDTERTPRERQIDGLIAQFEQAADQGRPLNREDFLKAHAEFAVELREYLDDAGRLQEAVEPFRAELDETEPMSDSAPR